MKYLAKAPTEERGIGRSLTLIRILRSQPTVIAATPGRYTTIRPHACSIGIPTIRAVCTTTTTAGDVRETSFHQLAYGFVFALSHSTEYLMEAMTMSSRMKSGKKHHRSRGKNGSMWTMDNVQNYPGFQGEG